MSTPSGSMTPVYTTTSTSVGLHWETPKTSKSTPASRIHRVRPLTPEDGDIYIPTSGVDNLEVYVKGRWFKLDGSTTPSADLDPQRPMDVELD